MSSQLKVAWEKTKSASERSLAESTSRHLTLLWLGTGLILYFANKIQFLLSQAILL